jgi:hypothetical protein
MCQHFFRHKIPCIQILPSGRAFACQSPPDRLIRSLEYERSSPPRHCPTAARTTHIGLYSVLDEKLPRAVGSILTATVGMHDETRRRRSLAEHHRQRLVYTLSVYGQPWSSQPRHANTEPAHGKIQPAFARGKVGDIPNRDRIGGLHRKPPVELVRCHRSGGIFFPQALHFLVEMLVIDLFLVALHTVICPYSGVNTCAKMRELDRASVVALWSPRPQRSTTTKPMIAIVARFPYLRLRCES